MAYTFYIQSAFSKGENEEGWSYQTAEEIINQVLKTSSGRAYISEEGYFIYESSNARAE